ncbi:MFS monocarboxylate transporter [Aspergillus sp. HF37]|nr:MFS monocarboxylate transporter [Aspergillus sp. HF37]
MAPNSNTSEPVKSEHSVRAWLTLLGAFSTSFCSVGFINAFGIFQEYYGSHQLREHSDFDISWIGSFSVFALFGGAPIAGVLFDRAGPTVLLIPGSLAMLVGVFMTSLCTEYYQFFLAQALLLGSSMSFPLCAAISTVSRHFNKNKGLAMGITIAGSSLGGVIWPITINELLNRDGVSFGWTLRIVGFIMLPLLILAVLTVDLPSGDKKRQGHSSEQGNQVQQRKRRPVMVLVTNTTFLLLCAGLATCYLGMFSPFFYITSYAESTGHPVSFAFYLVSIVNAASLFGRILPGFLADRYGHFEICSLAALCSGIVAFCWTPVKSTAALVVWALAYGFASGAIMSLQTACAAILATPETQGTALGFVMGSLALSALFGTPISGQLVGTYGYLALSMYAGSSLVAGSLLIFCARLKFKGGLIHRHN